MVALRGYLPAFMPVRHAERRGRGTTATATWNPASIADGDNATTTVTVQGAELGDFVLSSFSVSLGGLALCAYVSAANTVTAVLLNNTGGAVDLASGTLKVKVLKF